MAWASGTVGSRSVRIDVIQRIDMLYVAGTDKDSWFEMKRPMIVGFERNDEKNS
jgi:hypothetical protein